VTNGLSLIDISSKEDVRNVARAILVHRRDDLDLFDRAFDLFWSAQRERTEEPLEDVLDDLTPPRRAGAPEEEGERHSGGTRRQGMRLTPKPATEGAGEGEPVIFATYSAGEILRQRDFGQYSEDELAEARRFLSEMRWSVTRRRSRRTRPSGRGRKLDVRRSIRRSVARGGELLDLAWRGPKRKRRQIVLLCDISGSMDRYTRMLLHFLHSMETSDERVEVFVFGTRLTRITRALHRRDPDRAIAAVSKDVRDFSGGTRIGESLRAFNRQWARRVLGHGAIVIMISDGWDRGDPELLSREMQRLQRESYRLIWLNPLLGSENYQPLTRGIRAALPYVDDFLPVHNLASLDALAAVLNDVQEGRPDRVQRPRAV
jgi:uncharacterized protein with von Willebrand factor type A (vWA) domain